MSIAVVTGASSGIGRCLALRLAQEGFEVYGFGRTFAPNDLTVPHFHAVVCDLRATADVLREVDRIRLHEELNAEKIEEMVSVNLTSPMILTQRLLRDLKKNQGTVVLMSSVTAKLPSPHGCAYAATKAGLSSFGASLFDEVRRYGVKVITVQPDMTATRLYRHADFTVDDDPQAYLVPEDVADAVLFALSGKERFVMREITLRPQLHRIRRKSRTAGKDEAQDAGDPVL